MRALVRAVLLAAALGSLGAAWANAAPPYDSNTRLGVGPRRPPPPPSVPPIDAGFVDRLKVDGGTPPR